MDDLLSEFLTETNENIAVLDSELVKLERNPNDPELLGSIFRLVHTIKGTCGFLGLPRLEKVAHAAENVLGMFRDGSLKVDSAAVTLILKSLDRIKMIISTLEKTEAEPPGEDGDLITELNNAANAVQAKAASQTPPKGQMLSGAEAKTPTAIIAPAPPPAAAPPPPAAAPTPPPAAAQDTPPSQMPPQSLAPSRSRDMTPGQAAASQNTPGQNPAGQTPASQTPPGQNLAVNEAQAQHVTNDSTISTQSIRVTVELLESLMTTVSELVLTRNQLLQIVRRHKESEFAAPLQRLSHVTSELQEGVMKTRMQPIGNAWAKLPRLIRDLSLELGKKIELQMIGAETELDRQVLELIKDPLTHMVRNSADHGIESPDQRIANGKPEAGRITLNAYHEGGHILIEISDDGKGLDTNRIREKVVQLGFASLGEVESLTDSQVQQYIFRAGFSTASKVTAVSGRGVGMDVVRSNIEKIGGTIEMKSHIGVGSSFTIKIPLTLAIVSALIVESCGERFAIPQISVIELVRTADNSDHKIERIHDTPVLRLRNRLLPLVSLEKVLRLDRNLTRHAAAESFIIVTQVGTYNFGIMVDRVFDTEEIVVKPVSPILRHLSIFSGNTILGDGSVIMILDPNGLATLSGEIVVADSNSAQLLENQANAREQRRIERTSLLVFMAGSNDVPKAVPLSLVARLEEIDLTKVENSGSKPMVQYRGKLMPLIVLDANRTLQGEGVVPVLVFADEARSMGLVVNEIIDIVEEQVHIELVTDRPGVLGSAIISGRATDIVDAGYYLVQAFGDWFGSAARSQVSTRHRARRVLLVDDSPFFRNLLTPLLSVAGYDVTTAEAGDVALKLADKGVEFDIIVSDIEMPRMDGFEFARSVRKHPRWHSTPLIALSSHVGQAELAQGREAGFNDYVPKFDRDALVQTLNDSLMVGSKG
ncbi:MAG: chemotaxis protein CheW [Candidatus Symbiobacter sp.]|nr:chemotaxis protein CheW [Candidatus Symbiobacter sp.]